MQHALLHYVCKGLLKNIDIKLPIISVKLLNRHPTGFNDSNSLNELMVPTNTFIYNS